MTASVAPRAVGSVAPFPLDVVGGGFDESLWRLWSRDFAQVSAFRTARGALRALLAAEDVTRLWLPAYVCDVMATAAPPGCEVRFYALGPGQALAGLDPAPRDGVLAVDYFGRSAPPELRQCAAERRDVLWIEDRAQALQPDAPAWGDVLLYSPRKLVGVADGGLLVSNRTLPDPRGPAEPAEAQAWTPHVARYEDADGSHPAGWSPRFRVREASLDSGPAPMGRLSQALLQRIAAAPLVAQRRANHARLKDRLADYALWPEAEPLYSPMALPLRVLDIAGVVGRLAEERIYCARHWASLPSPAADFPGAHRLSGELLSLPCDAHYSEADMDRVAEAVLRLALPAGQLR